MLWNEFLTNQGQIVHKRAHYFPVYERHLSRFVNQSVIMWEIGVSHGGSLQLWKRYLGPMAVIIGIDINEECKRNEDRHIHIRIGSQDDTTFLQGIIDEFGTPDIILDDGSHIMGHITASSDYLYPRLNNNGLYLVEDLHTCYWPEYGGGLRRPDSFIEHCKRLIDSLNAWYIPNSAEAVNDFTKNTYSMTFYVSIVAFEKKNLYIPPYAIRTGTSQPGKIAKDVETLILQGKQLETIVTNLEKKFDQNNAPSLFLSRKQKMLLWLINPIVKRLSNATNFQRFNENPAIFFQSLKSRKYRIFGRIFFPKPEDTTLP